MKISDIATIVRGASPRPISNFVTDNKNGVNWIKIGDARLNSKYIDSCKEKITEEGAKKSRKVKKGDFILSNSMSFGRPYVLNIDGCIHDGWLSISGFDNYVLSDYLYFLLNTDNLQNEMRQKASNGGAVSNLNADIVKNLTIQVPPMETQQEIVDILNNFEKICNDLQEGIPAEIKAVKQQYEYYLYNILNFKEITKH